MAQVGEQALVVGALQPGQFRLVHARGPEGEPDAHRGAVDLAVVEVAIDDGAQLVARVVADLGAVAGDGVLQLAQDLPHCSIEQAVLVAEVVGDDPAGQPCLLRDGGDGRIGHADLVDGLESGPDQLFAPYRFHAFLRHCLSTDCDPKDRAAGHYAF
uniref:Uncharacterized protein n=1 Tax=Panagrolaimus superbus TaxID=310955 RepID=A0A914YV75_9BILA